MKKFSYNKELAGCWRVDQGQLMKITSGNIISQLLFGTENNSRKKGGPIVDGSEIAALAKESGGLKAAAQKANEAEDSDAVAITIIEPPVPVETTETEAAPIEESSSSEEVSTASADSEIMALAQRYVDLYEKNTGKDLPDDSEEQEMVKNVANFYGTNADRMNRLSNLVSAFDSEI